MKNFSKFFAGIIFALTLILVGQSFAFAAEAPKGIPSGGKGTSEALAIEDMQTSTLKKVLAQITERSEDKNSPYQQLLGRWKEFIDSYKVEKKGKAPNGAFVTGRVVIKYRELQAALKEIVKSANSDEDTRKVYLFVRFSSPNISEVQNQQAETVILDRYFTRLAENSFDVANGDEIKNKFPQTRKMDFNQFVNWAKNEWKNLAEAPVAIIGEIRMGKLGEEDAEGSVASCEIDIQAFELITDINNPDNIQYKLIDRYEGSDMLRMKKEDLNRIGMFMFEKAAVTSSKAITGSLVNYWMKK